MSRSSGEHELVRALKKEVVYWQPDAIELASADCCRTDLSLNQFMQNSKQYWNSSNAVGWMIWLELLFTYLGWGVVVSSGLAVLAIIALVSSKLSG